jgi:hypothetical protein
MGWRERWKAAGAAYQDMAADGIASAPKWARITEVGRRLGPFLSLQLEIHHGDEPPYEVSTRTWTPRGVSPEFGQDVAFHISVGDDSTHYEVDWDKPPRYGIPASASGGPRTPRQEATYQVLTARRNWTPAGSPAPNSTAS